MSTAHRPLIITIAVILGMIGAGTAFIFTLFVVGLIPIVGIIMILFPLIQIAILTGLWRMKRWALIVYTVFFAIDAITTPPDIFMIIPLLVIIAGFMNYRDMD